MIPLVLCPGLLNDEALWRHQIDSLGDVAASTVADTSHRNELGQMADILLALAPPRFALAGLSLGGYLAFEVLRRAPDRVVRLALFNTTARPDAPAAGQRRLDMIDIARRGGFDRLPSQIFATQLYRPHQDDRRITEPLRAMAARIGAEGFIRQQTAIMHRPDSRPDLPAIACPTLVVCGRQDSLTPPEIMSEIATGIPGARFVVVEEAGHLTPLEQPQAVSALLRLWLQMA